MELEPSFHFIGSRDQTEVVRLGSKCLYPLSHVTSPTLQTYVEGSVRDSFGT